MGFYKFLQNREKPRIPGNPKEQASLKKEEDLIYSTQ
jgi:hypothetical protein